MCIRDRYQRRVRGYRRQGMSFHVPGTAGGGSMLQSGDLVSHRVLTRLIAVADGPGICVLPKVQAVDLHARAMERDYNHIESVECRVKQQSGHRHCVPEVNPRHFKDQVKPFPSPWSNSPDKWSEPVARRSPETRSFSCSLYESQPEFKYDTGKIGPATLSSSKSSWLPQSQEVRAPWRDHYEGTVPRVSAQERADSWRYGKLRGNTDLKTIQDPMGQLLAMMNRDMPPSMQEQHEEEIPEPAAEEVVTLDDVERPEDRMRRLNAELAELQTQMLQTKDRAERKRLKKRCRELDREIGAEPVSYTHLTLPTKRIV
eukprot:TRINITY_DN3274_c0_g1_i5.p1 TRINITY_DN3274_c0_g1~~TRINITY_DN3274_c0_g1_i5.p1  ORF type:complete len:315 (+),score=45.27 TRINITY_DN3274_c0_g1_i5:88-1032(+)